MTEEQYFVYGSCATRDIFSELDLDARVCGYLARNSLISRMAPPQEEVPDISRLKSNFQRRMIRHDFAKTGLEVEKRSVVVLDFIDERFEILSWGNSYVTQSRELRSSGIAAQNNAKLAFRRGTPEDYAAWEVACTRFGLLVSQLGLRVVLNEARYATSVRGGALPNDEWLSWLETAREHNERLNQYSRIFASHVPLLGKLQPPDELLVAEPNHKWGLAPFHYILPYYAEAWRQLQTLTC